MAATATATMSVLFDLRLKPKPSSVLAVRSQVYLPETAVLTNSHSSILLGVRSESAPLRRRFSLQEVEAADKTDGGGEISGAEEEEKRRKLYVANAPWNFSAPELAKLFGECGTVKGVEMIKQKSGQSKGFAFVTMSSGEEARAAVDKFDSYELNGRIISVEFSKSFRKPPPPPRSGSIAVDKRCQICVSNLAWKVRSVHLREFFSEKYNPVSTRVVFQNPKGRSCGYGFVSFATKEEAESAISELDGKENDVRLERVLKEAAMEDKTVILTTLNAAWASPGSVIDLFLESFLIGNGTRKLLDHLVIVGLDHEAYLRCISIHRHCFALVTQGVDFSGQKDFMSTGYLLLMWRRIDFLRLILEKGYNFIFSDGDIMWFRNPLSQFYADGDFQIACDHFLGDPTDLSNRPNGGFNYVRTNNRTIEFYKFWYSSREKYPGYHDQDVLNFIKNDPVIAEIGVRIRFLSTEYFGGICEPSKYFNKACTMHANCCIGLQRKLDDLRVMLDDWRKYMSLPWSIKMSSLHTWSVPQNCSLAPLSPHQHV